MGGSVFEQAGIRFLDNNGARFANRADGSCYLALRVTDKIADHIGIEQIAHQILTGSSASAERSAENHPRVVKALPTPPAVTLAVRWIESKEGALRSIQTNAHQIRRDIFKEIARFFDIQPKPGTAGGDRFGMAASRGTG